MSATRNDVQAQVELLAIRAAELADRVSAGQLGFIDAVDMAYDAAVFAGLVETIGDYAIQKVLAAAFGRVGTEGGGGGVVLKESRKAAS